MGEDADEMKNDDEIYDDNENDMITIMYYVYSPGGVLFEIKEGGRRG